MQESEELNARRMEALRGLATRSAAHRPLEEVLQDSLDTVTTSGSGVVAAAVLLPLEGRDPVIAVSGPRDDAGFDDLLERVAACMAHGCVQSEHGCHIASADCALPDGDPARAVGMRSPAPAAVCLPLRSGGARRRGNLLAQVDPAIPFDADAREFVATLKDHLARSVDMLRTLSRNQEDAAEQIATAQRQAEHLERALESNRLIGTAVGILMAGSRITSEEAFDRLRASSQRTNRKLRELADEVVLTGALPAAPGASRRPSRSP